MNNIQSLVDEMRVVTDNKPAQNQNIEDIIAEYTPKEVEPIAEPETEKTKKDLKEETKKLTSETSADIFIGAFDFVQHQILGRIHKGKLKNRLSDLFGDEYMPLMDETIDKLERAKINKQDLQLSKNEARMASLLKRHNNVMNDIPFTEQEIENIKEPFAKVISEMGGEIPPSMAMLLLGMQIMGPRVADAFFE